MILLHFNNHKIKNIVPIKDINKKSVFTSFLGECNFINDSYNKNG